MIHVNAPRRSMLSWVSWWGTRYPSFCTLPISWTWRGCSMVECVQPSLAAYSRVVWRGSLSTRLQSQFVHIHFHRTSKLRLICRDVSPERSRFNPTPNTCALCSSALPQHITDATSCGDGVVPLLEFIQNTVPNIQFFQINFRQQIYT